MTQGKNIVAVFIIILSAACGSAESHRPATPQLGGLEPSALPLATDTAGNPQGPLDEGLAVSSEPSTATDVSTVPGPDVPSVPAVPTEPAESPDGEGADAIPDIQFACPFDHVLTGIRTLKADAVGEAAFQSISHVQCGLVSPVGTISTIIGYDTAGVQVAGYALSTAYYDVVGCDAWETDAVVGITPVFDAVGNVVAFDLLCRPLTDPTLPGNTVLDPSVALCPSGSVANGLTVPAEGGLGQLALSCLQLPSFSSNPADEDVSDGEGDDSAGELPPETAWTPPSQEPNLEIVQVAHSCPAGSYVTRLITILQYVNPAQAKVVDIAAIACSHPVDGNAVESGVYMGAANPVTTTPMANNALGQVVYPMACGGQLLRGWSLALYTTVGSAYALHDELECVSLAQVDQPTEDPSSATICAADEAVQTVNFIKQYGGIIAMVPTCAIVDDGSSGDEDDVSPSSDDTAPVADGVAEEPSSSAGGQSDGNNLQFAGSMIAFKGQWSILGSEESMAILWSAMGTTDDAVAADEPPPDDDAVEEDAADAKDPCEQLKDYGEPQFYSACIKGGQS